MKACLILGAAAIVAASPAPLVASTSSAPATALPTATGFDFAAIQAAPEPTGPAIGVSSQDDVYDAAAAESAAVDAGASIQKRNLNKRTWGWFWPKFDWSKLWWPSSGGTTTTEEDDTSDHPATSSEAAASTEAPATTQAPSGTLNEVPSSCTPISWTNTFAFTTDPACPEPFEVGTFCGFINPEDPCAPQPDGYGPVPEDDSVAGYKASEELHSLAQSAQDPQGYKNTFKDLSATVNANTYLGFHTLKSYDVEGCAQLCNDKDLCTAFNIYIERDPKWNPEKCSCSMPDPITNFKCSLWGSGVDSGAAVNVGQNRGDFEVIIIGSNGYEKSEETQPETPEGCSKPVKCPTGRAHDKPSSIVKQHFFSGPFDVALCAKFALSHNAENKLLGRTLGSSKSCSFFDAFMIKENDIPKGTYCKLFSEILDNASATWTPGNNNGHSYSLERSWSYCVD